MSAGHHEGSAADEGDDAVMRTQVERFLIVLSELPASSWLYSGSTSRDDSGVEPIGTAGGASAPNGTSGDGWRGLAESLVEYGPPGKGIDPRLAKALLAALDDPSRWAAEPYRAPPARDAAEN